MGSGRHEPSILVSPRQASREAAGQDNSGNARQGVSTRTTQRDAASVRESERQANVARVREYMAQGYTQDEAIKLRAAELRAGAIEKLISEGRLVTFAEASQYAAKMAQPRDDNED